MTAVDSKVMRGISRTPVEQALANLENALRALALTPRGESDYCPHPLDIVRSEINNAKRYLAIESAEKEAA